MDEARDFYERYIAAFNARDMDSFVQFFHLPVTMLPLPAGDQGSEAAPVVVTDPAQLWPDLPSHWTRSSIDEIRVVSGDADFAPREHLGEDERRRFALLATVTRWTGDQPYEQLLVLYLLTRRHGRLGITTMVPLARAEQTPAAG